MNILKDSELSENCSMKAFLTCTCGGVLRTYMMPSAISSLYMCNVELKNCSPASSKSVRSVLTTPGDKL